MVTREKIVELMVQSALTREAGDIPQMIEDDLNHFIGKDTEKHERVAIVQKISLGDIYLITGLFESIVKSLPNKKIFFVTQPHYFPVVISNPHVFRCIPYHPFFENHMWMCKYFSYCFLPFVGTQRFPNYTHDGESGLYQSYCEQMKND